MAVDFSADAATILRCFGVMPRAALGAEPDQLMTLQVCAEALRDDLKVWTSQYRRTQLTARHIQAPKVVQTNLGEILAGDHDNMTYEEIAKTFPVEFAMRDKDKLCYRYPNGESYLDVVER